MNIKWNDRTPFYFTGTIFLLTSIILSIIFTFYHQNNLIDFYPNEDFYDDKRIHDKTLGDKLIWYISQITHQSQYLLFIYFIFALCGNKQDGYFKIIAPLCLTVSALYFYLLYPKQSLKIYQLSFYNFFAHFMIIFLVFGELYYVKNYNFNETGYCLIFFITTIIITLINYGLRGVWTYDLIKLNKLSGWLLVSKTVLVIYCFSFLLYFIKPGKTICKPYYKNAPFISALCNLIFVLWFIRDDKMRINT